VKRILIADDHEVVRSGLRALIETHADWVVSGEAGDGKEAFARAMEIRPDVAVLDYSMPLMTGVEVTRRLRSNDLRTEFLILTMHENEAILGEVLMAEVRGFLLKSDAGRHLILAIEALLDHRPYLSSLVVEKLLRDYQLSKRNRPAIDLSSGEQNVVQLVAEGHTNRSIGDVLALSVKTVESHRASAMRKLGFSSTAELVRYAIRTKLIRL
jgi:DNA-binding NarL/FixJ family response regulator